MKELIGRQDDGKFIVRCDKCGKETSPRGNKQLTDNLSRDCHCFQRVEQKTQDHPLYVTWRGMVKRCHNPNDKDYKSYGARGIQVFEAWRRDFWSFVSDIEAQIGKRPEGTSLDRHPNNDGDYCPNNVRWATQEQQCNNTRKTASAKGYYQTPSGKFKAQIASKGRSIKLGTFDTPEEARHQYLIALHNKLNGNPIK